MTSKEAKCSISAEGGASYNGSEQHSDRPAVVVSNNNGSQESMCVARYTLAVDRRGARDGQQSADFISCVAFGKNGEFAEKYLKQGTKIVVTGRIQTGSYTNRDGQKVYTTDASSKYLSK